MPWLQGRFLKPEVSHGKEMSAPSPAPKPALATKSAAKASALDSNALGVLNRWIDGLSEYGIGGSAMSDSGSNATFATDMPSQQSTTTASAARKAERMDAKALTALDQWIDALPQSGMDSSCSRDATSDAGTLGTRATFVSGLASGEVPQHLVDLNLQKRGSKVRQRVSMVWQVALDMFQVWEE